MGLLDKIKGMVNTDDEYGDNYGLDETENDDIIPTRSLGFKTRPESLRA